MEFVLEHECFWVTEARLESWEGFQSRRGTYGTKDTEEPSNGLVTIVFAPDGRDTVPMTDEEVASVQWLLDNEIEVSAAILSELALAYPRLQTECGYIQSEREELMADIASPRDLRNLIGLYAVNVHQISRDGKPYIGFEFGCNWDDEHGLGILMHGTRMVELGGADTAFLLWIAEKDAAAT